MACAWIGAAGLRPAAAAEKPAPDGSAAGTREGATCRWFMVEAGDLMYDAGGGARVAALCQRAKSAGYNGLLLWDSNLWMKRLPPAYVENARSLKAALEKLNFTLMIEMCPRGIHLLNWSGDPSILEPKPASRTPEEREYRYFCLSHPGVIPIWEEQIRRAEQIYHPQGWLLMYDEIRVACADERCRKSGKTPAELLAEHARETIAMVRRATPGRVVAIWNDMFDPYHNARAGRYYHVDKGFSGSWEGIDKEVLVINWNDKIESFRFWAERGNPQIFAGYYDGELGPEKEGSLARQARALPGMIGWMYTTWNGNFSQMEPYLALSGFRRPKNASGNDIPALFLNQPRGGNEEER
jgi:hypothetical protein